MAVWNTGKKNGMYGRKHTAESKRKMSESSKGICGGNLKGKTHTKEAREKISKANEGNKKMLGKKHTEETKDKLRKAWTPEKRAMLSEKLTGRKFTEEHKRNISLAKKGKTTNRKGAKHTLESKKKISLGIKEKHRDQVFAKRMSNAMKQRTLSLEHKDKLYLANIGNTYMKGKKHSEETKKKMSLVQISRRQKEYTKQYIDRLIIAKDTYTHLINIMKEFYEKDVHSDLKDYGWLSKVSYDINELLIIDEFLDTSLITIDEFITQKKTKEKNDKRN